MTEAANRAAMLRGKRVDLEKAAARAVARPSFAAALTRADVAVIAEVKRASPSRGEIRSSLNAADQAVAYAAGGAAAISVLTEPSRFGGSLADLETISAAVSIPLLRKDFIVSEEQVLEARISGASATLLIARALPPQRLRELVTFARALGVEPLVEVRTPHELASGLASGARIIGINARDLETLAIDDALPPRMAAMVPRECVCIAESGLESRADVERVAGAGADAVLIGTALSSSSDPAAAVQALVGVPRRARAARD